MNVLEKVKALVVDLSGYDEEDVIVDAQFMELGFDSLYLTQLSQTIQREFNVTIAFRQLMDELSSVEKLAAHIANERPDLAGSGAQERVEQDARTDAWIATGDGDISAAAQAISDQVQHVRSEDAGELESVLLQQLELMRRQLQLLDGLSEPVAQARGSVPDAGSEMRVEPTASLAESSLAAVESATPPRTRASRRRTASEGLTPHQLKHLRSLIKRWNEMTPESKRLTQQYRRVHADPRTAAGFNPLWKDLVYPVVVQRSEGAYLWDVDGNRYIDVLNGFGPDFFGHSPKIINEALRRQLDLGYEIGPQTPLAGEAAALVCELTGMDRASFVCTGSEAVQAAMRAARTHTGRDRIVVFSKDYHGNFDEVLVRGANRAGSLRTLPAAPGIPSHAVSDIIVLEYGADAALATIESLGDSLAAVMVEPVQTRCPELQPREFLHALRDITRKFGTVLIFDEVVTGFRPHPGGAQAIFGVEADLATYGKVVAGGLPIGIVAGRSPFIDVFDGGYWDYGDDSAPPSGVTFFAGTFVRHPLAIAAAHAALTYMKEQGPSLQATLNARADRFIAGLNKIVKAYEAPLEIPHFGSQYFFRPSGDDPFANLIFAMMRSRGIHVLEGFPSYLSLAQTDADLDAVARAFEDSVQEMIAADFWSGPTKAARRHPDQAPSAPDIPVMPAAAPPIEGARLGRDADGKPAWFAPDPQHPGKYRQVG